MTTLKSDDKRRTLKSIRRFGVNSAIVSSIASTGWVRPIIAQVDLPEHSCTTEPCDPACGTAEITATLLRCTRGAIDIFITPTDASTLTIDAVPAVTAEGWDITGFDSVPANITTATPYKMTVGGPVTDQITCYPADDVPIRYGRPLTTILVEATLVCSTDGTIIKPSTNIIPLIEPFS